MVGSQTVTLGAPTGSLGGFIMGGFGFGGPLANSSSSLVGAPTGPSNGSNSGMQVFQGSAAHFEKTHSRQSSWSRFRHTSYIVLAYILDSFDIVINTDLQKGLYEPLGPDLPFHVQRNSSNCWFQALGCHD